MASDMDFNGADAQDAAFDLIPANTLVKVTMIIRPGGAGPEGWLTQSQASAAQYLNTEAIVMEGPFARRRIYTRIGFRGILKACLGKGCEFECIRICGYRGVEAVGNSIVGDLGSRLGQVNRVDKSIDRCDLAATVRYLGMIDVVRKNAVGFKITSTFFPIDVIANLNTTPISSR